MYPEDIESTRNPRVKHVVRLRKRSFRTEQGVLLIEGYRELRRAIDHGVKPVDVYFCPTLYLGENENSLLYECEAGGARLFVCSKAAFEKMAYRDRPDGLLAIAPAVKNRLDELNLPENPLLLVAERIEKPGNLGTMLRTADAAGADAVVVCDPCTDINNPNVVRASIGTLFSVPAAEASSEETIAWLRAHGIQIVSATPHSTKNYTEADLSKPTAIVVGAEQFGLTETWRGQADVEVRIPMLGSADSLNVSAAATILLYEAVRQRS